jgi:hypothetical protein
MDAEPVTRQSGIVPLILSDQVVTSRDPEDSGSAGVPTAHTRGRNSTDSSHVSLENLRRYQGQTRIPGREGQGPAGISSAKANVEATWAADDERR